jgi:hypothetical protein
MGQTVEARRAKRCARLLSMVSETRMAEEREAHVRRIAEIDDEAEREVRTRRIAEIDAALERVKRRMLDEEREFVAELEERVRAVERGDAGPETIEEGDLEVLEPIYLTMDKYEMLPPEVEERVRRMCRASAKDDFEAGKFDTIEEALIHYGLRDETERREKDGGSIQLA